MLVISDSEDQIQGMRVEPVFATGAKLRKLLRVPRMRRIVREFNPDLVHGHYLTVGGFYAALSGGKRIVGSAWGSDIYFGPRRSALERMVLRFVLRSCDLVFAGTKDMAEHVRSYGYDGPLRIFRFGVDPSAFKRTSRHGTGEFRILSIRPCSRIYNPLVVLAGFKEALPDLPGAYLYLLDQGNMLDSVKEALRSSPTIAEHVRFVPRTPYADMPSVYNSADIAVSIPDSDSAAASVLEAMACELPVIASDIPPMREWIEGDRTGHLTAVDASALAVRLKKAYSNRESLERMGKAAREMVLDTANQGTFESNIRVAEAAYAALLRGELESG